MVRPVIISLIFTWALFSCKNPMTCENLPRLNRDIKESLARLESNKIDGELVPGLEIRKYNQLKINRTNLKLNCP